MKHHSPIIPNKCTSQSSIFRGVPMIVHAIPLNSLCSPLDPLCCPFVNPLETVVSRLPPGPVVNENRKQFTHHSPHRPEPSKRLRAKVDEGILHVCAWMVGPQPCCSPQANSCWCQEAKLRAVEPFFISGKPYLSEPWCASHRAIENTYFLHAGWYFSPALRKTC